MSDSRQRISSGSPYESIIGISRAVRVGGFVSVALESLGAGLADVVRTRILLTRIEDWEAVARVHGEFFQAVRPVNTVMQVSRFIDPDWLVEVEADAVCD